MKDVNREEREDREESRIVRLPAVRPDSPLSAEAEWVMCRTIGCAIAVHRELGPGFLESIYRKAICIELESRKLAYGRERFA
jgi:hypothetical protein